MRKIYSFLMLAAMLCSMQVQAECTYTPNLFNLPPDGQAAVEGEGLSNSAKVGSILCDASATREGVWMDAVSSDTTVLLLYVPENGATMACYAIGKGEAMITYTENGYDDTTQVECTSDHLFQFTVSEGDPEAHFILNGQTIEKFAVDFGQETYDLPEPQVIIKRFDTVSLSFVDSIIPISELILESDDPNVASFDQDGQLIIHASGFTTISLRWNGDDNWNPVEAEFPLTVAKPNLEIAFDQEAYTAPLRCGRFESPIAHTIPEGLTVTYSSNDDSIASVDPETGELTLNAAGEVKIMAYSEGNEAYAGNETYYILYVEEGAMMEPSFSFDYETDEFYATLGEEFEAPSLTNPEDLQVMWSSSNDTVASVDSLGNVRINAVGEATIYATTHGNECFFQAHAEYKLIVNEPFIGLTVLGVEVTMDNKDEIWGDQISYNPETRTLTFDNVILDMRQMPKEISSVVDDLNETDGVLNVALVGRNEFTNTLMGFQHQIGVRFFGDTLILDGTESQIYADQVIIDGAYISVTSSLGKETPALRADSLAIINGGLLEAKSTAEEGGKAASAFSLYMDEDIAILTEGVEFYRFEDQYYGGFFTDADHSVDAKELTIGQRGEEKMPIKLTVCGIEVTEDNARDILGNGKAVYDIDHRILRLTDLAMDFEDSAFMADGGAVVLDMNEDQIMGPVLVIINGQCSFTNTYTGFNGIYGFNFGTDSVGSLYLSGQLMQIAANEVTIDGVNVTAIASFGDNTPAISAPDGLTILENGHLLAKNTNDGTSENRGGIAIEAQVLEMEENMAILTKGVIFQGADEDHKTGGFFMEDGSFAREVELGVKPVVVPDDEVTTIDFTTPTADGNEEVIISLGVNDTYNEATGQLEISTSLTDEEVAEALETLVPGSGAFAAALPGSITFDVPAGKGAIDIQCVTLPGFTLNVKIEGQAAISLTQTQLGWAHVDYDVEVPVHVVLYLHAQQEASLANRIKAKATEEQAALCIQAIKITPTNAQQGIEELPVVELNNQKVLFEGQIYIIREGHVYNALGTEIR